MPRLNVVNPAQSTGKVKEIFEGPLKGKHLNIFKGLANSAAGLNAYVSLSGALAGGELSAKEREVIALVLGEANRCDYCLAAHTFLGKQAGLTEEQTIAARAGKLTDPKLGALARFANTLHEKRGFVSEQDLQAFRSAGYTDGHVVEVVANVALNYYTNFFNHVNDTPVDMPKAPVLA